MKKLLLSLFVIIVLTGCGRDTKKEKSITCTSEQADTQRSLKLYATDNIVDKLTLEITIPESTTKFNKSF